MGSPPVKTLEGNEIFRDNIFKANNFTFLHEFEVEVSLTETQTKGFSNSCILLFFHPMATQLF